MHDYIPGDEANKMEWLGRFAVWVGANGTSQGFTSAEVSDFIALASQAPVEVAHCITAHNVARAATATKKDAINRAIRQARIMAQRLQIYPTMTDTARAAANITIPGLNPTPTDPEDILALLPPLLLLDFSMRHQITIHWGPNPANEQRNGRPIGVRGCQIYAARGGIPDEESGWIALDLSTRSPHIHQVEETTPTTYVYRARYVGINLKYGNFSDHATCTVSV